MKILQRLENLQVNTIIYFNSHFMYIRKHLVVQSCARLLTKHLLISQVNQFLSQDSIQLTGGQNLNRCIKKNSKLDYGNYRPDNLICIISKILEKAVYVQIEKQLTDNNLLNDYHSGFRNSYSTDTCLINLIDHIKLLESRRL